MGMPIHNWGSPASFKLWVDQIVTASSSPERPLAGRRVTLTGKRATFIIAAGAVYAPGSPNASKNYLEPWLRTLFGSLGIKDMQFVLADGTRETNKGMRGRTGPRSLRHILRQFTLSSSNQTAARPKNGRPLQNPTAPRQDGFVAAVPSREFRDGTGTFTVKLSQYEKSGSLPDLRALGHN